VATGSQEASAATGRLAQRLRSLREQEPSRLTQEPRHLTQQDLARALGGHKQLSGATISMWENGTRIPTEDRLRAYALFFSTARSFSGNHPKLLERSDLRGEELERLHELESELLDLREAALVGDVPAPGQADHILYFPDGALVTIVCADVPEGEQPRHADPTDLNFVRASSFADLDALLDLYGYLRAENPSANVRIRAARDLKAEEVTDHLVLLGGVIWNEATRRFADQIQLPVEQDPAGDDIFVVATDDERREFRPRLEDGVLQEDFGLFARAPNPQAPNHSVTFCNGVTTRGVRGAVQCFTDPNLRGPNEQYAAERFSGLSTWGLLMRVEVLNGEPLTPDLSKDETRVFEWPPEPGRTE
jgi:transcriptional regulator with XRE-family HTH domain